MAHRLRTVDCVDDTRQADFLECNGDLGIFDRGLLPSEPPFAAVVPVSQCLKFGIHTNLSSKLSLPIGENWVVPSGCMAFGLDYTAAPCPLK
jgi:hypothetical protein